MIEPVRSSRMNNDILSLGANLHTFTLFLRYSQYEDTTSVAYIKTRAAFPMASQRIPLRPSIWSSSSYPTKLSRWRCLPKRESSIYTGLQEISEDILPQSSLQRSGPSDEAIQSFDPVASTKARKTQLPPSRYTHHPRPTLQLTS